MSATIKTLPLHFLFEEVIGEFLELFLTRSCVAQTQTQSYLLLVQLLVQVAQFPLAVTDPDLPLLFESVLTRALQLLIDALCVVFVLELNLRNLLERVNLMLAHLETCLQFLDRLVLVATFDIVERLFPICLIVKRVDLDTFVQEVKTL